MPHEATLAIIEQTNKEINAPYSRARRIKGYFRNKVRRANRVLFGGSDSHADRAKAFGTNLIHAVPKIAAFGAKMIPIVGPFVSALAKKGASLAAEKVIEKLGDARVKDLRARQEAGSMTVGEMTEFMQRQGDYVLNKDAIEKLQDAIRKVDEAWTEARQSIIAANNCETIYKAAKDYAYLKYRIVRMHYYVEKIREYLDAVDEVSERYSAQVIGFQYDLIEAMDEFYNKTDISYHLQHCKKSKESCYYMQEF